MNPNCKMFWIQALSPVHVGTGTGTGFIDLPVAREKRNGWPLIPGSALKGTIRRDFKTRAGPGNSLQAVEDYAFGLSDIDHSNAGALVFSDAKILCMPVQSRRGTLAMVTCPLALQGLVRDLMVTGALNPSIVPKKVPSVDRYEMLVGGKSALKDNNDVAILGEINFQAKTNDLASKWGNYISEQVLPAGYWRGFFQERFAIIHDDFFTHFSISATEVRARTKIDEETGTVVKGGLWYEENLPADTILYGFVFYDDRLKNNGTSGKNPGVFDQVCPSETIYLTIGGHFTVGQGRISLTFRS